eukprot:455061_1
MDITKMHPNETLIKKTLNMLHSSKRGEILQRATIDQKLFSYLGNSYLWGIIDSNILQRVKNIPYTHYYESNAVCIAGINFYFRIYPNGARFCGEKHVGFCICVANFPPNVHRFIFKYNIYFLENKLTKFGTTQIKKEYCDKNNSIGHSIILLEKRSLIRLKKQFIFKINIHILQMFDKKGNIVDLNYKSNSLPMELPKASCSWKIRKHDMRTLKSNQFPFASKIFDKFGLKWFIIFGVDPIFNHQIRIRLILAEDLTKNVSKIRVLCRYMWNNIYFEDSLVGIYSSKGDWHGVFLSMNGDLIKYNHGTVVVDITILNAYDFEGNQICLRQHWSEKYPYLKKENEFDDTSFSFRESENDERIEMKRIRTAKRCFQCGSIKGFHIERLQKCKKCKTAIYCSRMCQKRHWKNKHRIRCL